MKDIKKIKITEYECKKYSKRKWKQKEMNEKYDKNINK